MSIEKAKEEIAQLERNIRQLDSEIARFGEMRNRFEREIQLRRDYITVYPEYAEILQPSLSE